MSKGKSGRRKRMNKQINNVCAGLARQGACNTSQSQSSTAPAAGVECPLFPETLQPPPGFGKLSVVYNKARWKTPEDGVHRFVQARSGAAAGKADYGIDRSKAYENKKSENAPLLHPEYKGHYNYEGRKFDNLTIQEKNQLEMAIHYPNIKNGTMRAPLYFRSRPLAQPEAIQPKLVNHIFGTREIFEKIFVHLIPRYEDLASLCGTSQLIARMVQSSWLHIDTTSLRFFGWDKYCLQEVRELEAQEEKRRATNGNLKKVQPRPFSPAIIMSPIRPENQGPMREMVRNKAGYPINSIVPADEPTSFELSMTAHYKLLHFSYLNGDAIKHLVLHGMPWVNVATLKCIVPCMPKLEALGVHQCFLMTFCDTQPFLHAINVINKERTELKPPQPHIAADYSPFYYRGPHYNADGSGHVGEYGIVPEEIDWLDSQRAVTAQLVGIWDSCEKGNQDFFTPGTGFRAFLDRVPLRGLPKILRAIAALHDFYNKKHHSGVGVPHWCKSHTHYSDGPDKAPIISQDLKHAMEVTVWHDLIIACNGESVVQERLHDWLVLRGEVKLHRCRDCEMSLPSYFYLATMLQRREEDMVCHGCQLEIQLATKNEWRIYNHRRELAESIFRTKTNKELSLSKVIRRIGKPAREAVEAGPKNEAISARDAIPALPGAVDMRLLEGACELWEWLIIGIPNQIRDVRDKIQTIEETYDYLSFDDRLEKSAEKNKLLDKELWLEFQQGLTQRGTNNGRLMKSCVSWEHLVRERRAEMAIENGKFVNNGPRFMLNIRAEATSMLGSSGGLDEYWNDESDEEPVLKDNYLRGYDDTASVGIVSEAQNRPSISSSERSSPDSMLVSGTTAVDNFMTTSLATDSHYDNSNRVERPDKQRQPTAWTPSDLRNGTQGSVPTATNILRTPVPKSISSDSNVAEQKPMSYAVAASSHNTGPGRGPKTTVQPKTKGLLPHERRPQSDSEIVENDQTPVQETSQLPEKLLPHQRRTRIAPQVVENNPKPVQDSTQLPKKLLPHQRRTRIVPQMAPTEPAETSPDQQQAQPTAQTNNTSPRRTLTLEEADAEYYEILKETIEAKAESDAAATARTGVPPPPRWLINAAAASRDSPHQGWTLMLASWHSAHTGER